MAVALPLIILAGAVAAQTLPPPPPPPAPKNLPLQSSLYDAEQLAADKAWTTPALQAELDLGEIRLDDQRRVHVTIRGPEGADAVPVALVESVGGRDDTSWRAARDAWVPVDRLTELARTLPPGYFLGRVEAPDPCDVAGEGPGVINADSYRDGGANGAGRTIAIIDAGFDGLTEAWNNGDIPSPYHWTNYTDQPLESVTVHGTGCVEAAFDHCPGAAFRLYMVDSVTDLGSAVGDAIAAGVNVISMSLSYRNTGWDDNSGNACAAINWAALNGIIPVVSAGNYARCHYQNTFYGGGDSPDWHDFASGDETINMVISDGETVHFSLQWNTAGGTYDYDLYLLDSNFNTIVAGTNPDNYFESFSWTNETGVDQTVHLAVLRFEGGTTQFEIFTRYGDWQQYRMAWSSTASPSNSTHANVISVGAVPWDDFTSPPGSSGINASYSSQGPSNGGTFLPDVCGPTNCVGFTYPNGMGGTSNSAPNTAGAICAFWSADTLLHPDAVRWLVFHQALQWRDWGDAGQDLIYGWGGTFLYDFAPSTLWIARGYNNTGNVRDHPLYTVQAAHDLATPGGRLLIFPGGSYPEPALLDRALTVETTAYTATLGE